MALPCSFLYKNKQGEGKDMSEKEEAKGSCLKIEDILGLLPHRYPFVLVDRVLEWKKDSYLEAIKNVTINEPFFPGHFPDEKVMPGVLIVEALGQASALLALLSLGGIGEDKKIYFAGIEKARFKRKVVPGDQLKLVVSPFRIKKNFWKVMAEASVDGEIVVEAELTAVID